MRCALSFLVTLPLRAFSGYRFRERRDRPLCHLMVRQQTWQESQNSDQSSLDCKCGNREAISKPGACARRHVQAIRLRSLVVTMAGDRLLLWTKPPRPCAASCWLTPLLPPGRACVTRDWPARYSELKFASSSAQHGMRSLHEELSQHPVNFCPCPRTASLKR